MLKMLDLRNATFSVWCISSRSPKYMMAQESVQRPAGVPLRDPGAHREMAEQYVSARCAHCSNSFNNDQGLHVELSWRILSRYLNTFRKPYKYIRIKTRLNTDVVTSPCDSPSTLIWTWLLVITVVNSLLLTLRLQNQKLRSIKVLFKSPQNKNDNRRHQCLAVCVPGSVPLVVYVYI